MIRMYGIANCDIIKKAIKFFAENDLLFEFHDYKKEGISAGKLKEWCGEVGWQTLFNKRSTTWKQIMNTSEGIVNNQAEAIHIMQQHTSIIKRPVIEINGEIIVGFDKSLYKDKILNNSKK